MQITFVGFIFIFIGYISSSVERYFDMNAEVATKAKEIFPSDFQETGFAIP